jgi:hypothetical protein
MVNHGTNKSSVTIKQLAKELMPDWEKNEKKDKNWFQWPPDIFALTSIFLKTTGIYCYTVTPHPENKKRLNCGIPKKDRTEQIREICSAWYRWITGAQDDLPEELEKCRQTLFAEQDKIESGSYSYSYEYCCAVQKLHMLADEACAGMGILSTAPYGPISAIYFLANYLMDAAGTLSRLPKRHGVVLPKMRTPQRGLTIRSFSHHLTFHRSEVNVLWRTVPWDDRNEKTVNILAIPMPYEMDSQAFCPCDYTGQEDDGKNFKYFEYKSTQPFKVETVINLLEAAHKEVDRVHIIVFPELALTELDSLELKEALVNNIKPPNQFPMIITGIRGKDNERRINQVQLSVFFANKWYDMGQDKHHKWKLDRRQIEQYSLGGRLNVQSQWWEAIDLRPPRELTFLVPNGWLTICPLICEDLAQLEPVSDLIRGVGPTLVVAILMDGPQLPHRWPARYVSVLADDPGTSVLTLTSLGMALRSRAKGKPINRTVALWKDQVTDWEQIELKEGAEAVLLTVTAETNEEFTADGRSDGGVSARLVLQSTCNLHQAKHEKTNNDVGAILQSSPEDLKDLTALSFLAGAIVDAPSKLIKEFRSRVRKGNNGGGRNNLMKRIRPFDSLWNEIKAGLREGENKHPEELDYAVGQLCAFVTPVNSVLDKLMDPGKVGRQTPRQRAIALKARRKEQVGRWWILVEKALDQLSPQGSSVKPKSKNKRGNISKSDIERFDRIVLFSILWAVYNRLMNLRNIPDLPEAESYHKLQDRIEGWMASTSGY